MESSIPLLFREVRFYRRPKKAKKSSDGKLDLTAASDEDARVVAERIFEARRPRRNPDSKVWAACLLLNKPWVKYRLLDNDVDLHYVAGAGRKLTNCSVHLYTLLAIVSG